MLLQKYQPELFPPAPAAPTEQKATDVPAGENIPRKPRETAKTAPVAEASPLSLEEGAQNDVGGSIACARVEEERSARWNVPHVAAQAT